MHYSKEVWDAKKIKIKKRITVSMLTNGIKWSPRLKKVHEKCLEKGKKLIRCMGGLLHKEIKESRIIQFGKEREGI